MTADPMAAVREARKERTEELVPEEDLEDVGTRPALSDPDTASTWIEINELVLRRNWENLQEFLGKDVAVVHVVKGNAYGHGYDPIVPALQSFGQRRFAVFSSAEAHAVSQVMEEDTSLQIMGYVPPHSIPWVVHKGIQPWLGAAHLWPAMRSEARRQQKELKLHLELETGMHRTGVQYSTALDIARQIVDEEYITLEGVCTHLAGAEDRHNKARLQLQRIAYNRFIDELADHGIEPKHKHVASSAAAILDPHCRLNMVRIGISTYGFWPTNEVYHRHRIAYGGEARLELDRVLAWKSHLMDINEVPDGDYIGYGLAQQAEGDRLIGVVPVGYADGFSRDLSGRGYVLLRGRRASIMGVVNMNMIIVNLTHIPEASPGDEVTLVGRQGDQEITVTSFADYNNVVNYEFMARIPEGIPRVLVKGVDVYEDPLSDRRLDKAAP